MSVVFHWEAIKEKEKKPSKSQIFISFKLLLGFYLCRPSFLDINVWTGYAPLALFSSLR